MTRNIVYVTVGNIAKRIEVGRPMGRAGKKDRLSDRGCSKPDVNKWYTKLKDNLVATYVS